MFSLYCQCWINESRYLVLELEQYVRQCNGLDVSETGSGPGSYDIAKSVWHVNCCNGLTDGWWMVLMLFLVGQILQLMVVFSVI